MKANKDKCHLAISTNEKVPVKIDNIELESTSSEKLLGIIIDSKLNFKEHLAGIIKKVSRNVNVLSRITPYMNLNKRKLLTKLIVYTKDVYVSSVMIINHHSKNYEIRIRVSQYMSRMYKHLQ